MDGREKIITLRLTREEAQELFARCLRSNEDDNEYSSAVLQKLARILHQGDGESYRKSA